MDDFGTGYSSLSYLRSFPFDRIKIDQSFVQQLATRGDSMAIVRAVTGLGKSLGIITTAGGVDTPEQLALLRLDVAPRSRVNFLVHRARLQKSKSCCQNLPPPECPTARAPSPGGPQPDP